MSRIRLFPYRIEHIFDKWQGNKSFLTFSLGFCFTGILGRGATFFCLLCSGPKEFKINFSQMSLNLQLMLNSNDDSSTDWPAKKGALEKNKKLFRGFPGGAVVENMPAKAGDTGSSPGLGRSHMLRSN